MADRADGHYVGGFSFSWWHVWFAVRRPRQAATRDVVWRTVLVTGLFLLPQRVRFRGTDQTEHVRCAVRDIRDIALETYAGFVRGKHGGGRRALCLYASDAEIFDFRPGRFRTEEKLSDDKRMDASGTGFCRRDSPTAR